MHSCYAVMKIIKFKGYLNGNNVIIPKLSGNQGLNLELNNQIKSLLVGAEIALQLPKNLIK